MRMYDTNLSWWFGFEVWGIVIYAHWWYDRGMRMRRWMPLEVSFVRRNRQGESEAYITDMGTCSNCGYELDFDNLSSFEVEESGVQPGTVHGPAVHWARGVWICPHCSARLPFETST